MDMRELKALEIAARTRIAFDGNVIEAAPATEARGVVGALAVG